tara:strand:+ start:26799 stop:27866 length:1068 start_codon:yes stop_codon:yes gene_type:complete
LKKKKHIALICNYVLNLNRVGGMDRFFWSYNKALREQGHKVTWFFPEGKVFEDYKEFEICLAGEETLEASVLRSKGHFDIIITHFIPLCTPFYKALKKKGNPYIIAVDHNPRPINGFSRSKKVKNKIKGLFYSKFIDVFVGVSKYTKDAILNDYGFHLKEKTKVIYNGIETSIYASREKENQGKFIVASHLRESKGIQDLIEAVNILPDQFLPLLQIDIFGEGPLENHLKERVRSYKLEKQINFKGSSPQLPALLKNYSFLLQPTYMECFSLSILESLAANVPVITTPVGGNLEIIEHGVNGFIFEPGDIKELTHILQQVLLGEMKIDQRVDHNIKENYNLRKMVQEHINILPCT